MTIVLNEGRWPGSYLVSDDIHLSRESVTFASGAVIDSGTVLGKIADSGKYVPLDIGAKDGREIPAGIAYDNVDASSEDQCAVASVRQSAVKASELIWPKGLTASAKAKAVATLAKNTIILR